MQATDTLFRLAAVLAVGLAGAGHLVRPSWAIVTSDAYGTHVAEPGVAMLGIDHDGVAQIIRNGSFYCTGALLEGGRHVLTAGHCISSLAITSVTARFTLADGVIDLEAESWTPHPSYGQLQGCDVGIITLAAKAPPQIPRYSPIRTIGSEIDNPMVIFGYGITGYGGTGKGSRDGNKRGGRNLFEATGATENINLCTVGGTSTDRWLFSDFDSGQPENDGFGLHFGKADVGFGADEVITSNHDSGAPGFVHNGYTFGIAGIETAGARFQGSPNADLDGTVNETWGEFTRYTRIAAPENLDFIESHLASALEPVQISASSPTQPYAVRVTGEPGRMVYIRISRDLVHWEPMLVHQMTQTTDQIDLRSAGDLESVEHAFFAATGERD